MNHELMFSWTQDINGQAWPFGCASVEHMVSSVIKIKDLALFDLLVGAHESFLFLFFSFLSSFLLLSFFPLSSFLLPSSVSQGFL